MQEIIEKIKNGERAAFRALYDQFSRPMYNICYRITGDESSANDVLQDAFIKVFQSLNQLENVQLFPAWIKKVVVNTALLYVKSHKKWSSDFSIDALPSEEIEEDDSDFIDEEEHEIKMKNIREAILDLPEKYRLVFTLHVIEEYSHEEIAKMLQIASSTSRSQYLRAKIKLKELVKKNKSYV